MTLIIVSHSSTLDFLYKNEIYYIMILIRKKKMEKYECSIILK
jgi:hypothetical protein